MPKKIISIRSLTSRINYKKDMPWEVISIVQNATSVGEIKDILVKVLREIQCGATIDPEVLPHLEKIAILFGFEHNLSCLLESYASIYKNFQVPEGDKELVWAAFYDSRNYSVEDAIEEAELAIYRALVGMPRDPEAYTVDSRIKQYLSLVLKVGRILEELDGPKISKGISTVREMLERLEQHRSVIASDPVRYFDDLIGFKFVINDAEMDDQARRDALTHYSDLVEGALALLGSIRVTKSRKESRVPGYEAVNLYVQGLLNHRLYGNLPIKIQFRFREAMLQEAAMYYTYKMYGCWEMPPWAKDINFDEITTFEQLQEALFSNFKQFFATSKPATQFSIRDAITMPPGWPSLFDLDLGSGH